MLKKIKHELNYFTLSDIVGCFLFLMSLLPACVLKIYIKIQGKKIWLVTEDKNEARDNGICFFRYINSIDSEITTYYAIKYNSADYKKVASIGKTVRYGSIKHWVLYLNAEYNISTQKSGRPSAAVGYVLEMLGIIRNKAVFLQHGITLSRAKWLFFENTKMRLFICGAKPEYEYVQKEFGYPVENVAYLGLCRFDDYHKKHDVKRQILLIPSWREWIGSKNEYSKIYEDTSRFENTEYYRKYQSLINNLMLEKILEENNVELVFYPHRNMQQYISSFSTSCNRIRIANNKTSDIRELLIESALMITDYSSVALDFAYMKKPVVFYQFDEERFREAQYEKGYFDYRTCNLGNWTSTEEQVIKTIQEIVQKGFSTGVGFTQAHSAFFPLYDNKNCERTYLHIKGLKK